MNEQVPFVIFINGQRHEVDQAALTGLQVRVLAGVGPEFEIIIEGANDVHDRLLAPDEMISLSSGPVNAYVKPPTAFGFY